MNVGVQDGLIDPKHEEAMGSAVWLFLWCIRCETQKSGFVLGGAALSYAEISRRSGFPERRIRRWLDRLRKHNYVRVLYTNYKMLRIEIMKPKKWFPKQQNMFHGSHRPQTVSHDRPQTVSPVSTNGQSNKSCSLRENSKTPLPPAGAGDETIYDYMGNAVAVKMGNHKRLPKISGAGSSLYVTYFVEKLNNMGFPARIVDKE